MKLKQRAIVTTSLLLGMTCVVFIVILFGSRPEEAEKKVGKETQKVKLPDIPGVPDYIVDERVNNPNNKDRQAVADGLVARYNRSRGLPDSRRDHHPIGPPKDPFLEASEKKRRLQHKLESFKSTEEVDKHPRGPELLEVLVQKNSEKLSDQVTKEKPIRSERDEIPLGIDPWNLWHSWVKQDWFYPKDAFWSREMNSILHAMATYPITSFDVGHKGTQLKVSMYLNKQRTAFKPMRYSRNEIIEGDPYAGFDRHNAEIAGFHLDGLLGFRIAPPVVGRRVNLTALWPLTTKSLRSTYYKDDAGNTCFYGKCYYCRREEAACAQRDVMEGSVTLWLPDWYEMKTRRHPYQRTYRANRKAEWEKDQSYCYKNIINKTNSVYFDGLLEFTDSSIFDFLMGNADRHHYETYAKAKKHGKLLHIDNGKSFGNPNHDEMSILAPLNQCCRVRESTWERLQELLYSGTSLSHQLDQSLKRDPVYPILTPLHLEAIDRRLTIIDKTIRQCFNRYRRETVLVDNWPPKRRP